MPLDAVEPFEPPRHYYRFKEGVWVNFKRTMVRGHHTRRGYVKDVVDMHATVIDERTFTEVSDHLYSKKLKYTVYSLTSIHATWRSARCKDRLCRRAIPSILWLTRRLSSVGALRKGSMVASKRLGPRH